MKNIWFISDTHWDHENFIRFEHDDGSLIRPFSSVEDMNEHMIEKWNEYVKPGDKVYHLGDVCFGDKWIKKNWSRLIGSKRLIVGNHDDVKFLSSGGFFKKVYMWRVFGEYGLVFSHVPLHPGSMSIGKTPMLNVHGHTHQNGSPSGPYHSVCVEKTNYRPIHLDELIEIRKEKIET